MVSFNIVSLLIEWNGWAGGGGLHSRTEGGEMSIVRKMWSLMNRFRSGAVGRCNY